MSYILDALRRADAERARGSVPDLHAQPLGLAPRPSRGGPRRGVRFLIAALGLIAAGTVGWIGWQFVAGPPDAAMQAALPPVPVAPAAALPSRPVVEQPAAAGGGPPMQAAAPPPVAPVAAPVTAAGPTASPPSLAAVPSPKADLRARSGQPVAAAPTSGAVTAPASARAASLPAPAEARVWQPAELPAELRRDLPSLRFGGAIHSPNPASRILIVDGLLLREGDEAAPGVRIHQIRLKSVVVEFRDRLVELGF